MNLWYLMFYKWEMGFDNKSGERYGASAVWIFFFCAGERFQGEQPSASLPVGDKGL